MLKSNRTPEELRRISACVALLCESVGRKPTETTYLAYELGTDGVPVEAVEEATQRALQQPTPFMPSPGELRKLSGAGGIPTAHRAALAFEAVMPAISRYGHWKSPDFDDPLINATIRHLGGWQRVCDLDVEEFEKWYRKDFIAAYAMLCDVGVRPDQAQPLLGGLEAENIAKGYTEAKYNNRVRVRTGLPWAGERVKVLGGVASEPKRIAQGAGA